MTTADDFPAGCIVAWYQLPASITTGVIGNVEPVRRIGRVSHVRPDGTLCVYDPDGIRAIVEPDAADVVSFQPDAGWGRL